MKFGRYEFTSGTSNKFWAAVPLPKRSVDQTLTEVEISWGRIGTKGQSQIVSIVEALKRIQEKINKGYVLVAEAGAELDAARERLARHDAVRDSKELAKMYGKKAKETEEKEFDLGEALALL